MELFFWGLGTVLAGVIFLLWSYAFHKELEEWEQQEEEKALWWRFTLISFKFENFKKTLTSIGFILLGVLMILASFGLI